MIRKTLIALYGTKEKTAIWFFGCLLVLIGTVYIKGGEVFPWNTYQKVVIGLIFFDVIISFGYFGKWPLKRSEMTEAQKRAADSI